MKLMTAILLLLTAAPAPAAVVVLFNATAAPVACTVTVGDAAPLAVELAVGESRPVPCGRVVTLSYAAMDGEKRLELDPWAAYMFITKKKTGLELMMCDLVGKSPGHRDVPKDFKPLAPVKIPVRIYVDETERRTQPAWTAALKKRFDQAAEILARDSGAQFELAGFDDWKAEAKITDFGSALADFETQVKADPDGIMIGFTSRVFAPPAKAEVPFALSRGMFAKHIILREGEPRTEPERMEVLVQQLGRWLGAVASPDEISVMRPKLGDGKAIHAKFRIGFDPLNLLAMQLTAEELRRGGAKAMAEWPPEPQVRLARVYATLAAASPEEPMNEEVMALLERAGLRAAAPVKPAVEPKPMPVEPKPVPNEVRPANAQAEATRKVVRAIVVRAEENNRQPVNQRLKGDALTEAYIRTAADVAFSLDEKLRKQAFLIGLGVALDDSEIIRNKPVFGEIWKAAESDEERKLRLAVLGNPTMKHRRDLCQHFVVSASLTMLGGPEAAEMVGLAKEKMDMDNPNGSGFSFHDLAADYAGVQFAEAIKAKGDFLNTVRQKFTVKDFLANADDLPEGLSKAKFEAKYGSTSDPRFKESVQMIKKRIADLSVYKK